MKTDSSAYDNFAWVYNKHWGMRFTPGAMAVLDEVVFPGLLEGAEILDVCCGTGQLAGILSERAYRVTGLDGSGEMLKYAQENAPDVGFIQADVRAFSLPERFDLATCFFDSLNHVLAIGELEQVFRNIHACLKPGGQFLFDLNLEAGYLDHWKGYNGIAEDDHVCLFPLEYDAENRLATFDAIIFRLIDGDWCRSEVHLVQRAYTVEEIRSVLGKAGFEIADVFEYSVQSGRQAVTAGSPRAFFLCKVRQSKNLP